MGDAVHEDGHDFDGVVAEGDVAGDAVADAGHALQQVAVGRGADAEGEDAGVAEFLLDCGEDLVLVADEAVGEEADVAEAALVTL